MSAVTPTKRVWTYADLDRLPDDDQLYEILGGELSVRNAPDANHAVVLTELFAFLVQAQEAGYGEVYTGTTAVALDFAERGEQARYVPHPDLFFMRRERAEQLRGRRGWEGVPDLIIEILSPSTRSDHQPGGRWWEAYERFGVPYYWLVHPRERRIDQHTLAGLAFAGGRYGSPVTCRAGDTLTCPLFPTITRSVDRVFQRVRDEEP